MGSFPNRTALYRLWLNLRNRCNNPKTPDFHYYGGRGIRVCPQWDYFVVFAADVGAHPGSGMTLDRIDNDKDYEPGNVRWATRQTQARNRPGYNVLDKPTADAIRAAYAAGGVTQTVLAQRHGITQTHVSRVIRGRMWA